MMRAFDEALIYTGRLQMTLRNRVSCRCSL